MHINIYHLHTSAWFLILLLMHFIHHYLSNFPNQVSYLASPIPMYVHMLKREHIIMVSSFENGNNLGKCLLLNLTTGPFTFNWVKF